MSKEEKLALKPTIADYVSEIDALDIFDKLRIYLDYKISIYGLYPHSYNTYSFEEFIDDQRLILYDHNNDWDKHGFAEKYDLRYSGIYDWYWKFKDRIVLRHEQKCWPTY